MTKEHLPEPFYSYWKMNKQTPATNSTPKNTENLSKEWVDFLEAISERVKAELTKKEK